MKLTQFVGLALAFVMLTALSSHAEECNGFLEMGGESLTILEKYECYGNFIREQKNKGSQACESLIVANKKIDKLSKIYTDSTIYLVGSTLYVVEYKGKKYSFSDNYDVGSPFRIIDISKFDNSIKKSYILNPKIDPNDFLDEGKPLFDFTKKNIEDNYWVMFDLPEEKKFKGKIFKFKSCK